MNSKKALLVFVLFALTAAPAQADMGPMIPGIKYARVTARIHTKEQLPDYLFVMIRNRFKFDQTKRQDISEDEAEYVQFSKDGVIETQGYRREDVELLIVPRNAAEPYKTAHELWDAASRIPTATKLNLHFNEEVPAWYGDDFTVNYRLQRRSSDERFELIRTTINPKWQCCVVCIAFPIATIFGGLWLVRRWRRNRISR